MTVPNESSEDVNDFLQRIRELGERRDKEDDERTKKLEEEILQGRKERQARRAERARSLALTDDSSLNTARLSISSTSPRSIDPRNTSNQHRKPRKRQHLSPRSRARWIRRRGSVTDFGLDSPSRTRPPLSRSRAGTLSWQQRPSSRDFGMSPGSTSPNRSPTRASHLRNLSTASEENTLSRLQFGFPRPTKDAPVLPPSPDRGAGWLAQSGKEEQTDSQKDVGLGQKEPDVDEESSTELDKLDTVEERSLSPPRTGSRDSNMSHRFSVSSVSAGLGSPVHLSETTKLEPRQNDFSFEESVPSPTQRRMSPERSRSTSPTKGLGGFVQSAMMRRSDSVSKRWSAQVPQGLGRSNSIVSNRSSVAGPSLTEAPPTLGQIGREPSTLLQRPGSSHSEATTETTERPTTPAGRDSVNFESPGKSFRPGHSRSASSATADGSDAQSPFVSKTMDPRRWSPSKASWLESALNRPELPRQTTRPPPQPNWVKERQSRGSVDLGRANNFKEVTPLGLMRTPPPGAQTILPGSGPSLPTSPTKDGVLESPLGFPLKKVGVAGPSLPASPVKDAVPESPSGFPFKKASVSGSSLNRNSVSDPPSEFPFKRPATPGGSVSGSPEGKLKETVAESPSGFPFNKSSVSGSSLHRNSVSDPPSEFPFKRPATPGGSVSGSPEGKLKETVAESPSGFPLRKPISSASSLHRNSVTEPPVEFPLKRPSVSGPSFSGSLAKETVPESPSELSSKRPSISSPSIPGTPEAKSKETVPESPSDLGSPDVDQTKEETSASPSPVEEALNALTSGAPSEESNSVPPSEMENESQELLATEDSEVAPERQSTPTRRAPPDSLSPKPNFSVSTSSRVPISPKVKPQAPVVDFRANLRKREVVKDSGSDKEPEFKNIFGRLKKTETRNYVAPDELKGNILRGKAALNTTGGPKKTERVDEFRKSLVLRKDEMKAGGGSIRRNTAGEQDAPPKQAEVIPEAIAMRQNMARGNSIKKTPVDEAISPARSFGSQLSQDRPAMSSPTSSFKSIPPSRASQDLQLSSPFSANDEPGWPLKDTSGSRASQESQLVSPFPPDDPIEEELEAVPTASDYKQLPEVVSSANQEEPRKTVATIQPTTVKMQEPSVKTLRPVRQWPPAPVAETTTVTPGLAAKSKLAGRINPALAGLLSRGAPAIDAPKKQLPTTASAQSDPASPSAPLTHITKGRARGPKRRLPQTTGVSTTSPQDDTKEVGAISYSEDTLSHTPIIPVESLDIDSEHLSQPDEEPVPDIKAPQPDSPITEQLPEVTTPPQDTSERDTPQSGIPQALQTRSLTTDFNIFPSPTLEATPTNPESPGEVSSPSGPPVPPKSDSPTTPSPVTPKPQWGQQNRFASSSPSPLQTSHKENQMDSRMSQQKSIPGVVVESARSSLSRSMSHPSPPVPPKDGDVMLPKPTDPRRLSRKMSAPSLVAQASEAREVLAGFFKTPPNARNRMDIDPQLMLMRKPDDVKIRTVKLLIWELTGDGRRQELPSHQEYILYQGSMYLCVHVFETGRSSTSEVYLWRGDDVPDSSVEDEQPFARKVARENSSKLQVIRQGNEPKRFIQALGGIMITRRGSSSRHNSSALYMLCGRKHLGEMTFDEVDYSLRNLCSGFPYVVSAPFGKLYLWKGKGSGPEETGAARLIGMDLGLTGEFEEVTEGEEPEDFFDIFAGPREAAPHMCQVHWHLKPKYNHFCTRLLRVDHEPVLPTRFWNIRRPGSGSPVVKANDCIQEIEPFCYRDITEKDVYVLDTFFEIYVIIGEQASQKSAEFTSAVVFAHEYGILATSLQDRPFIPKSYVALGGVADRCQSAFRKWNPRNQHAPFVFSLDVVIEAIRSPESE
ncbi:Small GTPase superfamily ARF/SAR type [Penicillium vulpinum]|uniref:Small GTPase superfamily ARF/SAR type n=1 Tax=Penicillium vulpinum TaxID=29845 RepID=UPI002549197C|nr:Small GTPase superfamily ARF/SAR type [Penicillium vulpinum]KAJ5970367.1 Small GTPase superfamily ARF/SAR type [Penicillium vulpinum]